MKQKKERNRNNKAYIFLKDKEIEILKKELNYLFKENRTLKEDKEKIKNDVDCK